MFILPLFIWTVNLPKKHKKANLDMEYDACQFLHFVDNHVSERVKTVILEKRRYT